MLDFFTFDAYCQEKWGFRKRYANTLIQGAELVGKLPDNLGSMLPNPRQVAALSSFPEPDREKVLEAASEKAKSLLPHLPGQPLLPHVTTGLENLFFVFTFKVRCRHDRCLDPADCPIQPGSDVGQRHKLFTLGLIS